LTIAARNSRAISRSVSKTLSRFSRASSNRETLLRRSSNPSSLLPGAATSPRGDPRVDRSGGGKRGSSSDPRHEARG
jgi:hypothetical protein